jgi:iron complex outermembrane receptor protein
MLGMPLAHAQVEEIMVSAQRRDANLQEVPISVSAFSAEDIANLQIDITSDLSAAVPNMQMYNVTANGAAMQVFMRGAGVQNPGFNASESPVGLYVDGIYHGRLATANLDLTDIERIEVLRGPQGTLYGRNTIAGAVKFITRNPEDEFWGNASVGYGNYDTTKVTASVGGGLIENKLGGSLAGVYHNRGEGWIERGVDSFGNQIPGRDLGEFDNVALRGKLNWFAGDVFDAVLSLGYVDAENDGYNGIPYGPSFSPPSVPGYPLQGFYTTTVTDNGAGFGKTKQFDAMLDLSWDLDSVVLHSLTGYGDVDDDFGFDLLAGATQNFFFPPPPTVLTGTDGLLIDSSATNKTFSQEFNVSGDSFNDKFIWLAGVFYMYEDGEQTYSPSFPAVGDAISEMVETTTDSYAVYAEGTWLFTEKFSGTLGGRWSRDEKEYSNNCANLGGGALLACRNTAGAVENWTLPLDEDFDEFTPRLVLEYQWLENLMTFASVSQGYQAGGFQTLCLGSETCNSIIYDPQTVTSWELGIKSEMLDQTLRINASAFYAQYDDVQQTAIVGDAFPLINAGDVDVSGFELETYWVPNDVFSAYLIYGYQDEDFDSATTALLNTERLPGMAHNSVRVGFDTQLPAFSNWAWAFGIDLNYSDDYLAALTADPDEQLTIPSYTRLNGRIGLMQPDGNWSVMLTGTNIADSEDLYSGIAGNGTNIRTPQPPREYMVTVNYTY